MAVPQLPRFAARKTDIFEATQQIRPLGGAPRDRQAERVAEAEMRGRREAEEKAKDEYERRRAEDHAAFSREMEEARAAWTADTADRIAGQLTTVLDEMRSTLADSVARALKPFLVNAVRERAVDELSETVLALLHAGRFATLRISGNAALVARLREKLADYPHSVEYQEGTPDVRVSVDDTRIETSIGAWIERLSAAAPGDRA